MSRILRCWKALFIVFLLSYCVPCVPSYGGEISIRSDHPRIWLTKELVGKLREEKGMLEVLNGKEAGMLSNALAYVLTKDEKTGRGVVDKAKLLLPTIMGRLTSWSGYAATHIHQAAICYDWCYDLLSEDEKKQFAGTMSQWAKWCRATAETEDPYGSCFWGCLWGEAVVGLTLYGDSPDAQSWVEHAKYQLFEKRGLGALSKLGGDWLEGNGFYHGPAALALYLEAQKTACNEDLYARTTFFKEAVDYHIHATMGGYKFIYPTGDYEYTEYYDECVSRSQWALHPEHSLVLVLARNSLGNGPEARRAQWLVDKVCGEGLGEPFANALWNRNDQRVEPSGSADMPLAYWNKKSGFVSMRASWEEKALGIGFYSGPRLARGQHGDQNSFCVIGGEGVILGSPAGLLWNASFAWLYGHRDSCRRCTMLFGCHGQAVKQDENCGRILAFGNQEHFAYAAGEAAAAYNSKELGHEPVENFTRHVLFLRPATLVVLDRALTKRDDLTKRWNISTILRGRVTKGSFLNKMEGDAAPWRTWCSVGNMTVYWAVLLPTAHTVSEFPPSWDGGVSNFQLLPLERRREDLFLNVFLLGGDKPPQASCERNGLNVKLLIKGEKEYLVNFLADNPAKGTITIKEGDKRLFDGALAGNK